jgi:hypothetical protein
MAISESPRMEKDWILPHILSGDDVAVRAWAEENDRRYAVVYHALRWR